METSTPRKSAFTLIELLTVIAVIAILAAILIPTTQMVRTKAMDSECVANLRQHGVATKMYASEHANRLPALNYLYVKDLWPYLYGGEAEAPSLVGTTFPERLRGTAFECPAMDQDVGAANERSYGVNSFIRSFYLKGGDADDKNYTGAPILLVEEPAGTVLFADTHERSNLSNDRWGLISQRHGGHVNSVFVDGHVEAVPGDDLRATTYNTVFWRGKHL